MKKLLVFVLMMTLVSVLTVSTVGCGKKDKTSSTGVVTSASPATVTTEKGK